MSKIRYWVADMQVMFKNSSKYPHGKRYQLVRTNADGSWTTTAFFNTRKTAQWHADNLNDGTLCPNVSK